MSSLNDGVQNLALDENKASPVKTVTASASIDGNQTDICISVYSNQLFIVVTQYNKFGTFVEVKKDFSPVAEDKPVYQCRILFGEDTDLIHVAARYITERINPSTPVLFSISLKDYSQSCLKQIVQLIGTKLEGIAR